MKQQSFNRTRAACYTAYVSQAIVNNLSPLLFARFHEEFAVTLSSLALLIGINFAVQLLTDLAAVYFVDKIGYRASAIAAGVFCAVGLCGMGVFPYLIGNAYAGLLLAVVINAIGGGLFEVIISPIIAALPVKNKSASMSLLHSFYCIGFIALVLLSTVYFAAAGIENWRFLPPLFALFPIACLILFTRAPLLALVEDKNAEIPLKSLFSKKLFWLLFLMMICAGASEQAMVQWASFFAETGLKVSKVTGDLLGPCAFAALMAVGRIYFGTREEETPLRRLLVLSAALCLFGYLLTVFSPFPLLSLAGCAITGLAVSVMWPGTFVLASQTFPLGGTAMFAILALSGDAGCGLGPGIAGVIMEGTTLKTGLLAAAIFPLLMAVFALAMKRRSLSQR